MDLLLDLYHINIEIVNIGPTVFPLKYQISIYASVSYPSICTDLAYDVFLSVFF